MTKDMGHGLLIQLKENQKELENDVAQIIKPKQPTQTYAAPIEQVHGRIENRKATVYRHGIPTIYLTNNGPDTSKQ